MPPKRQTSGERAEHIRVLQRLENHLLRGVRNHTELAAAFGCSPATVARWIKKIEERWKAEETTTQDGLRRLRIRQLEKIASLALASYERSRQDATEFSFSSKSCGSCDGRGVILDRDEDERECQECKGKGKIVVEVTKVKGQAGDPAFLRVAKECICEAGKFEGSLPSGAKMMGMRKLTTAVNAAGGECKQEFEEMYLEAPVDMLIEAKTFLLRLQDELKTGAAKLIPQKKDKSDDDIIEWSGGEE